MALHSYFSLSSHSFSFNFAYVSLLFSPSLRSISSHLPYFFFNSPMWSNLWRKIPKRSHIRRRRAKQPRSSSASFSFFLLLISFHPYYFIRKSKTDIAILLALFFASFLFLLFRLLLLLSSLLCLFFCCKKVACSFSPQNIYSHKNSTHPWISYIRFFILFQKPFASFFTTQPPSPRFAHKTMRSINVENNKTILP